MTTWEQEERPVERIGRLPADELPVRLESDPELQLLDVRELHVPCAMGVSWRDLVGVPAGIDSERLRFCGPRPARGDGRPVFSSGTVLRRDRRRGERRSEGGADTWVRLGLRLERAGLGAPVVR